MEYIAEEGDNERPLGMDTIIVILVNISTRMVISMRTIRKQV